MVTRDAIRNLKPGNRLEIQCKNTADLDSTYQTAWQMRNEMGISKDTMTISRIGTRQMVVVEYKADAP